LEITTAVFENKLTYYKNHTFWLEIII
jgi:hypothetical protein